MTSAVGRVTAAAASEFFFSVFLLLFFSLSLDQRHW